MWYLWVEINVMAGSWFIVGDNIEFEDNVDMDVGGINLSSQIDPRFINTAIIT